MKTSVDTSVLLEIRDEGSGSAMDALGSCLDDGALVVSPVVYAELSPRFNDREKLDDFLADLEISVEEISKVSAYAAGRIMRNYRAAGGARSRILADFLIGAHAMHQAGQLLTRDQGFYRECFRGLLILEP